MEQEISPRVLIIEDDVSLRTALEWLFELEGFVPVVAANGRDALELLERDQDFQAILLDLMMPGLNGWEFLRIRQGRASLHGIPVVVLSALSCDRSRMQALEADAFLPKPSGIDTIVSVVASVRRQGGFPQGGGDGNLSAS